MVTFQKIALALTILGAITWGLIGLFDFDLITFVFGIKTMLSRIVYILIGLAGIINIGLLVLNIDIK